MIFRFIAADWTGLGYTDKSGNWRPSTVEGEYTFDQALEFNGKGFNVYYYPNYPSDYSKIEDNPNRPGQKLPIKASDIDTFEWCFVDMDLKDYGSEIEEKNHSYKTKEDFVARLMSERVKPTLIIDSGNGIHAYWRISDLYSMSFLRLNKRLCRYFKTDRAVCNLKQILRMPNTINTKKEDSLKLSETLYSEFENAYESEVLDNWLPPISVKDEEDMQAHYNKAFSIQDTTINYSTDLPEKFITLSRQRPEIGSLFYDKQKDRSIADFKLAHALFANGLTREESMAVLYNTTKASERSPAHRHNYALNLVDKAWKDAVKDKPASSIEISTVKQILNDSTEIEGTRFPCTPIVDATDGGFRLGQVLGMVAGSGIGKTTLGLNFAVWFTEYNANSDYVHLIVSLEQPKIEIASRWKTMSATLKTKNPKVDWDNLLFILDNYNADGTHRNLGWDEIENHILEIQKITGKKVGSVQVDHIGLIKQGKGIGEYDGLNGNAKRMKSVAVRTNTFMIVQSQTSRGKAGIGDIELDIDSAFGASNFEWNSDYIMTLHQPLKRVADRAPHLLVTAFKYAKIRKKNVLKDRIKADVPYGLLFDPTTELLREMTTDELKAFDYWATQAVKERKRDKKTEAAPLKKVTWTEVLLTDPEVK